MRDIAIKSASHLENSSTMYKWTGCLAHTAKYNVAIYTGSSGLTVAAEARKWLWQRLTAVRDPFNALDRFRPKSGLISYTRKDPAIRSGIRPQRVRGPQECSRDPVLSRPGPDRVFTAEQES